MIKTRCKIVKNWKLIKRVVEWCKQTRYCCFDFETSGTEFHSPTFFPTCVSITFQIGSSYIIPLGHKDSHFKDEYIQILEYLGEELFTNKDVVKVVWNEKFERKVLLTYGVGLFGYVIDGMLCKYTLLEERPSDLKSMVSRFFPECAGYEDEIGKLAGKHGWGNIPLEPLCKYCGWDTDLTLRLSLRFEKNCMDYGFYNLLRNLILPLHRVYSYCEFDGLLVNREYLAGIKIDFENEIKILEDTLFSHGVLRRYERKKKKNHFKTLIREAKAEIRQIENEEGNEASKRRKISSREKKIQDYLSGNLITKKDKKGADKFNFDSPKQLIDLLFTSEYGFEFPIIKYTKDKKTKKFSKTPSTAEDVLVELKKLDDTGFIETFLKIRATGHLYSTYVKGIWERLTERDRVHGRFLIHGTVTGRLSSVDPNLQNMPRVTTDARIKKMFVGPKGKILFEVDYSQAELRVLAELAVEKEMIEWFNSGRNIHVAVAAKADNADYNEVQAILKDDKHPKNLYWTKRKKRAKTINFGIAYEQTEKALCETLNLDLEPGQKPYTEKQAKKFMVEWFELFPMVKKFMDSQHKLAKKQGYVDNMFGRRRRLDDIYSDHFGKFLEAQRQSTNAPIQGTASDFTQFSAIIIQKERLEGKLPLDLHQFASVHDSLDYHVKPTSIHKCVNPVLEICNNPETMKWFKFAMKYVRMKVSPEAGISWGELHDYDPWQNYQKLLDKR